MSKHKFWTWTCNNYTNEPTFSKKTMDYLGYVEQKAPKTGTIHLQGYTQYKCEQTKHMAETHMKLEQRPWIVKSRGTHEDNYNYIVKNDKKTNTWEKAKEFGNIVEAEGWETKQGERNDIKEVMEASKTKRKIELMEEYPEVMCKYGKFINEYKFECEWNDLKEPTYPIVCKWFRIEKPDVKNKKRHWLICGSPSVGKTQIMNEAFDGIRMFPVGSGKNFRYGHYKNEDIIVYDDVKNIEEEELIEVSNVHNHPKERYGGGEKNMTGACWKKGHVRVMVIIIMPQNIMKWMFDDWFTTRFETIIIN